MHAATGLQPVGKPTAWRSRTPGVEAGFRRPSWPGCSRMRLVPLSLASQAGREDRRQGQAAPPDGRSQRPQPPASPRQQDSRQQQQQQQQPQPQQQQQQRQQQRHTAAGPGQGPAAAVRQGPRGAPQSPPPPATRSPFLVVVEGRNDMQAVRRAVPGADVYVLGTSTAADSPAVLQASIHRQRHTCI